MQKELMMNSTYNVGSIYCQQHFGISKNHMRFMLLNVFNPVLAADKHINALVPAQQLLPVYKLRKVRTTKALEEASKGYIKLDGTNFIVVYHGCSRASCKKHNYLLLSYRAAAPEYELPAYVLIKPYYDDIRDGEVK